MIFEEKMKLAKLIIASIIGAAFVGVIVAKIWEAQITEFDFSDILALLLAFFAIALSTGFYMKSTETADRFYDNTYTFTKDISEKIGRLDERHGEQLQNLGKSQDQLRQDFRIVSERKSEVVQKAEETEQEVQELENERVIFINDLLDKAKLEEKEKQKLQRSFSQMESKLDGLRGVLEKLSSEKESLETINESTAKLIANSLPLLDRLFLFNACNSTRNEILRLKIGDKAPDSFCNGVLKKGSTMSVFLEHGLIDKNFVLSKNGVKFLTYIAAPE